MKDEVRFRPSTVLSTRRWPVPVVCRYGGALPPVTVTSACDHLAVCSVGDSLRPVPLGFSLSSLFIPGSLQAMWPPVQALHAGQAGASLCPVPGPLQASLIVHQDSMPSFWTPPRDRHVLRPCSFSKHSIRDVLFKFLDRMLFTFCKFTFTFISQGAEKSSLRPGRWASGKSWWERVGWGQLLFSPRAHGGTDRCRAGAPIVSGEPCYLSRISREEPQRSRVGPQGWGWGCRAELDVGGSVLGVLLWGGAAQLGDTHLSCTLWRTLTACGSPCDAPGLFWLGGCPVKEVG